MLKVKSFKLSDDAGVNILLERYRLAEGASIFVSNSEIMVPYDDGEPMNDAHRAIDIKLQINEMRSQQRTLRHSNNVVDNMSKQLEAQLDEATADFKSAPNNKSFESRKKQIEEQLLSNESAIRQNDYEIDRLEMNITLFTAELDSIV